MGKIHRIIVGFIFFAFLRYGRAWLFASAAGAKQTSTLGSSLADSAGVGGLSRSDLSVLTTCTVLYCIVFGLVTQLVLEEKGFGRGRNGAIGFLGVLATVFTYSRFWGAPAPDDLIGLGVACVLVSTLTLVIAALIKAFVLSEVDAFAVGGQSSLSKVVPRRGGASKGPSLDRLNLASRRFDY